MAFSNRNKKKWGKQWGWKCQNCGKKYKDGWKLEFHHIIPTSAGGGNQKHNCMLLCLHCHYLAHLELEKQGIGHKSANIVLARLKRTKGKWK